MHIAADAGAVHDLVEGCAAAAGVGGVAAEAVGDIAEEAGADGWADYGGGVAGLAACTETRVQTATRHAVNIFARINADVQSGVKGAGVIALRAHVDAVSAVHTPCDVAGEAGGGRVGGVEAVPSHAG